MHRAHFAWAIGLTLCASTACLDRQAGTRASVGDASAASDSAVDDIDGSDEVVACDPVTTKLTDQGVVTFDDQGVSFTPVMLDGATLYGIRVTIDINRVRSPRSLVAFDVVSGAERVLVANDEDHELLDARDGVVLISTISADRETTTLRYRDLQSGEEKVLFKGDLRGPTGVVPRGYFIDRTPRLVERGVAVWGEQTYGSSQPKSARVRIFRGGDITTLFEAESSIDSPQLRQGHVTWLDWTSITRRLWLASPEGPPIVIAEGLIESQVLTNDAAWWTTEGVVMRYDFGTGTSRTVHEGPCGQLVADAHQAAAVCGEPGGSFVTHAGQPFVFTASGVLPVATHGGPSIAGLRLFEDRIAWVEYPIDIGCGGAPYDEKGELVVATLASPDDPRVVATVLAGCWCCDAYWAPMQLALSPVAIAWNYSQLEPSEPDYASRDAVGWGVFAPRACP